MSKTTTIAVIALLILSNTIVFISNVDARTGAYIRGYAAGQADRAQQTYRSYDAWWIAGDQAIEDMNRQLQLQYRHDREHMIREAEARAIAEGYGWATGRTR
jgi:hypothetical protein